MTESKSRYLDFRFSQKHPSTILRDLLKSEHYVFAPGLFNAGGMKMAAHAGFKAGYLSGFSYAVEEHGVTDVGAFSRTELADQAKRMVRASKYWVREKYVETGKMYDEVPLIMDLEDGHGGFGQVQMFMQHILPGGVAGGHIEDQSERRCGHLPGKVIVPVEKQCERLMAARSEADQLGFDDFVLIARTDSFKAKYPVEGSMELAIERTIAYADLEIHNRRVIDLAWCEFPNQSLETMTYWARAVRKRHPDLPLAINLSSSFDWTNPEFDKFTFEQLADEGYKYMFMTLADFHSARNGSWIFFNLIQKKGIDAFAEMQYNEKGSGTPSISHNKMAGTSAYFAAGNAFGSKSFSATDIRDTDSALSEVDNKDE